MEQGERNHAQGRREASGAAQYGGKAVLPAGVRGNQRAGPAERCFHVQGRVLSSFRQEVLSALCARRAERAAAFTAEALPGATTPIARINAVLYGFMPLRLDETEFIAMLLPAVEKPEGRSIALTYQDALLTHFVPLLRAEITAAATVEAVFPPVKDMERLVLHLVNHCWIEAATAQAHALGEGNRLDALSLLQILEKYRRAIELLLDAPYGSVEIVRVEEWDEVFRRIAGM